MSDEDESDDLVCPITLEIFRDPVVAKDGRTYEREAITKWIIEHGTSPITREPLQIQDLVANENLKKVCEQKRKLSVSYNVTEDKLTLPKRKYFVRNSQQILPTSNHRPTFDCDPTRISNKLLVPLVFLSFILPISLIVGIDQGLNTPLQGKFSRGNIDEMKV